MGEKSERALVIDRLLQAPVDQVWRALTDREELKKWLPFSFPDFKAEVGFQTEFMLGPDAEHQYLHHVKVLEVVPGQTLHYSWDYGGMSPHSTVRFELREETNGTHVVLTCILDPVPP